MYICETSFIAQKGQNQKKLLARTISIFMVKESTRERRILELVHRKFKQKST